MSGGRKTCILLDIQSTHRLVFSRELLPLGARELHDFLSLDAGELLDDFSPLGHGEEHVGRLGLLRALRTYAHTHTPTHTHTHTHAHTYIYILHMYIYTCVRRSSVLPMCIRTQSTGGSCARAPLVSTGEPWRAITACAYACARRCMARHKPGLRAPHCASPRSR